MDLFFPALNQMAVLFIFIVIGLLLAKFNVVPQSTAGILAKLENWVFIPSLALQTFIGSFTVSNLSVTGKLLLFSLVVELIVLPISFLLAKAFAKDTYTRNIYTYGLCFSNFGFLGNAVVSALFPEIFFEYIIFTLVLWVFIYIWAVPSLLISDTEKTSVSSRLKSLANPMFISVVIGMIIGLTGITVPSSIASVIDISAACMSPVAMILTGITIAHISIKNLFSRLSIYGVTLVRLLLYPLTALAIFAILPLDIPDVYVICAVSCLAMPLGLNTIVIPAAYGKDTTTASGMALISHLISVITIPTVFLLLRILI